MGFPYYIRIREYDHTGATTPPRGHLEQLITTNIYCYSDKILVESSEGFEHQALQMAMTVLSARCIFSKKSFHVGSGDWSVPGGSSREEIYDWQDFRCDVSEGICTLHFVCETIKPEINTQVSWLQALAGASNISERSDAPALQAAGNPAIFWALVALATERGRQPSQLIDAVNRKNWRKPPVLGEEHMGRIVVVEIYRSPGVPRSEGYELPDP